MEDCLDASFRVFLEDLYSALYAASATAAFAGVPEGGMGMGKGEEEEEEEEGQETGQDSRPEVRACCLCMWSMYESRGAL